MENTIIYSNSHKAKNNSTELTCKLTTSELRERKATVLKGLKKQIIEKAELRDGYAYKFPGTDEVVDELSEFIKTERACCEAFVFGLSVSGDKTETWLNLTGPEGVEGVKDFISAELGL